MIVKDLIKYLKYMPQEMEVRMLVEGGMCAEGVGNICTYKLGNEIVVALWQEI